MYGWESGKRSQGSLFHKSIWHQTYLIWHTISSCGSSQTFMIFEGTVRVILPLVHHPRIQKPAVRRLPQPEVTSKPLNLITMKNHETNPSLIYLVPFWTNLYFLLPQLPVATRFTIKLHTVRKSMCFFFFWSYSLTTSRGSPCWIALSYVDALCSSWLKNFFIFSKWRWLMYLICPCLKPGIHFTSSWSLFSASF